MYRVTYSIDCGGYTGSHTYETNGWGLKTLRGIRLRVRRELEELFGTGSVTYVEVERVEW